MSTAGEAWESCSDVVSESESDILKRCARGAREKPMINKKVDWNKEFLVYMHLSSRISADLLIFCVARALSHLTQAFKGVMLHYFSHMSA